MTTNHVSETIVRTSGGSRMVIRENSSDQCTLQTVGWSGEQYSSVNLVGVKELVEELTRLAQRMAARQAGEAERKARE